MRVSKDLSSGIVSSLGWLYREGSGTYRVIFFRMYRV